MPALAIPTSSSGAFRDARFAIPTSPSFAGVKISLMPLKRDHINGILRSGRHNPGRDLSRSLGAPIRGRGRVLNLLAEPFAVSRATVPRAAGELSLPFLQRVASQPAIASPISSGLSSCTKCLPRCLERLSSIECRSSKKNSRRSYEHCGRWPWMIWRCTACVPLCRCEPISSGPTRTRTWNQSVMSALL